MRCVLQASLARLAGPSPPLARSPGGAGWQAARQSQQAAPYAAAAERGCRGRGGVKVVRRTSTSTQHGAACAEAAGAAAAGVASAWRDAEGCGSLLGRVRAHEYHPAEQQQQQERQQQQQQQQQERLGVRPGPLDLHWDLVMEGLVPMQRSGSGGGAGGLHGCDGSAAAAAAAAAAAEEEEAQAAAALRTLQLVAGQQRQQQQQQGADSGAEGSGSGGGDSSHGSPGGGAMRSSWDRLAPDSLRRMMDKAATRSVRHAAAAAAAAAGAECSTQAPAAAAAAAPAGDAAADAGARGEAGEAAAGASGSKAAYGYSWQRVFKAARANGWAPVGKAEGGGGSHFKLRRVLPLSGVTQTVMMACTPSDTLRGPRNAAAALNKKDAERDALEAAAAAAEARGGGGGGDAAAAAPLAGCQAGGGVAGTRRQQRRGARQQQRQR
jgi:hypothetical protein